MNSVHFIKDEKLEDGTERSVTIAWFPDNTGMPRGKISVKTEKEYRFDSVDRLRELIIQELPEAKKIDQGFCGECGTYKGECVCNESHNLQSSGV